MRVAFYMRGEKPVEQKLADAVKAGAPAGFKVDLFNMTKATDIRDGYDMGCVVGVKSAVLVRELEARGVPWLYFDKAYNRDWPAWWRVSYRGHQPTDYLMQLGCSGARAARQGWKLKPWRTTTPDAPVLFAGASLKYHLFCDLGDPTEYAQEIVTQIGASTSRPVIYRPKPSWAAAEAVEGASFSHGKAKGPEQGIRIDLAGAHALVTHGSAAVLEALLEGVPTVVLGHAVTRPISSTSLEQIDDPRLAVEGEREQLLANLAHCQWRTEEFRSGEAWAHVCSAMEIRGR